MEVASNKMGASNALQYISETFRVLKLYGVFAVITAMPPSVFRTIAINPLHAQYSSALIDDQNIQKIMSDKENSKSVITDWKSCKKKKIRTREGEYVYFYIIRKMANIDHFSKIEDSNSRLKTSEPDKGVSSIVHYILDFIIFSYVFISFVLTVHFFVSIIPINFFFEYRR